IRDFWYVLKDMTEEDEVRAMMANEPVFRDDKSFLPLQAADLSVWQIRNLLSNGDAPLNPIMTRLAAIPHLEYFIDGEWMRARIKDYDQVDWAHLLPDE